MNLAERSVYQRLSIARTLADMADEYCVSMSHINTELSFVKNQPRLVHYDISDCRPP